MKKIFTLFAALAMVMSMSATPYLRGSFNGWGTGNEFINGECSINLSANTTYEFKIAGANWDNEYAGGKVITKTNCTDVSIPSGGNNAKITSDLAGTYIFKWNASSKKLTVIYPSVVLEKKDITVKAKMPASWGTTITAWVWTAEDGNGKAVTPEKQGDWYVVTQNTTISYVIFRNGNDWNGDKNQTVDLAFQESTCVELTQSGNSKATYTIVDCPDFYNVTVTAENGTVTGAGEYEEGKEATLTATANEGYEFVNWTVAGEEVSTANPYTITVTENVTLVANFKEAEPELEVMDIEMTNLVVQEMEDFVVLTASDDSNTGLNVMLAVNEDGSLAADSYMAMVQGWNEVELPIVEGKITKAYNEELATDVYSGLVVVEFMEGKLGLNLTMYAKPVVATDVVVTDATITVETEDDGVGGTYEIINIAANWNGSVLKIEGVEKAHEGFIQITETFVVDGEEDWYIWMCMNGVITTVDNVLTVTGEFKNNWTGDVYNVTISGKLPVVEPTTITYELNGGAFPEVKVPTNEELWGADTADVNGFMHYFNHYNKLTRATQSMANAATFWSSGNDVDAKVMTSEDSEFKWLGDYIAKVTTEQITAGKLTVLAGVDNELKWRFGLAAFFNKKEAKDSNYNGNADFTEAGKPENWGPAYQAAHEVVLPTEPVDAPYTLPTPVKEGYTFVGWYDNAEGTGGAYTVIPAGWAGTLYAIWKQSPATALDNIAIEGKVVKTIINGQLIIIKNGVQYNAQGAVIK